MTTAVTIAVGLGGAILGATAAFLGTVYIESRRTRRTRLGMVRAVVSEMRQNAAAIVSVVIFGRLSLGGLSSETWHKAQFDLAQFLDKELYDRILLIYMLFPQISAEQGVGKADPKELWKWVEDSKRGIQALQLNLPAKMRSTIREAEFPEGVTPP